MQFAANDAEHGTENARAARFRCAAAASHYAESSIREPRAIPAGSKAAVHVISSQAKKKIKENGSWKTQSPGN